MFLKVFGICLLSTALFAQEFDARWKVLPKTFKGDNIVQIAKSLDTKKGEFESTEAFNARMAKLALTDRALFFFCDGIPLGVEYDVDAKEFSFSRKSYDVHLEVAKIEKNGKSYYGTNVFGVTKKVKELWNTAYALYDQGWDINAGLAFTLPCPSDQAPAVKKDLGMAVLANLVPHAHFGQKYNDMGNPFMSLSTFYREATVSSPLEYMSTTYTLVCDVQKVVVFRKSDRSILLVVAPKKTK